MFVNDASFVKTRTAFLLVGAAGRVDAVQDRADGSHAERCVGDGVHVHGRLDLAVAGAAVVDRTVDLLFEGLRSSGGDEPVVEIFIFYFSENVKMKKRCFFTCRYSIGI